MPVVITASYTGIQALIIVAMGISVTIRRFGYDVMIGDGRQDMLGRIVRIHSNLVENIPLCALLMALYVLDRGAKMVLHVACTVLIAGRTLFAGPWWFHDGPGPIQASGATPTWGTAALLAMLNILWLRS